MKETRKEAELKGIAYADETRRKINDILNKSEADDLINRIYRFVKYIYIHRT